VPRDLYVPSSQSQAVRSVGSLTRIPHGPADGQRDGGRNTDGEEPTHVVVILGPHVANDLAAERSQPCGGSSSASRTSMCPASGEPLITSGSSTTSPARTAARDPSVPRPAAGARDVPADGHAAAQEGSAAGSEFRAGYQWPSSARCPPGRGSCSLLATKQSGLASIACIVQQLPDTLPHRLRTS
jgi:hypothetical protein